MQRKVNSKSSFSLHPQNLQFFMSILFRDETNLNCFNQEVKSSSNKKHT